MKKTPVNFLIFTGRMSENFNLKYLKGEQDYIDPNRAFWDNYISTSNRVIGAYKLAHYCRLAGFTVQVIDFCAYFNEQEFINIFDKFVGEETLAIGTSSTFMTKQLTKKKTFTYIGSTNVEMYHYLPVETIEEENRITAHLKSINPNVKIMVGGGLVNKSFLENPNIDLIVQGYGEITVPQILQDIKDHKPLQQYYTDKTKIHDISKSTMFWCDEDMLDKNEVVPLEIARGCIFKCSFCSFQYIGKEPGTYVRGREFIKEELIRNYEKFGITKYWIVDDTFNDDNDRLEEIAKIAKELPFKLKLAAFIRIDLVYLKKQAQLLVDCGLEFAHCGIETLTPESAKDIGKGLNPWIIMDFIKELKQTTWKHVGVHSGFILGLPSDTKQDIKKALQFLGSDKNPLDSFLVSPLYLEDPNNPDHDVAKSDLSINHEQWQLKILPWSDPLIMETTSEKGLVNYMNKHGVVNEDVWSYRLRFYHNQNLTKNHYKLNYYAQYQVWGMDGVDEDIDLMFDKVKNKQVSFKDTTDIEMQRRKTYFENLMSIEKHTLFDSELLHDENRTESYLNITEQS